MSQSEALVDTLKAELKARGLTYAEIAKGLSLSEANIKRIFASKRFTLERLESICNLINIDLVDLSRLYDESRNLITYLTKDQEKELVADKELLLVAVCISHHYNFEDIINTYEISKSECIQHLAKLDRLNLIELLPNNRIRLLINEDFHWLPNGPIESFFEKTMQPEFLNTDFSKPNQIRLFLNGYLSQSSHEILLKKLQKLKVDFNELQKQDLHLPLQKKRTEAMFIAFRPWEFSAFKNMKRA